MPDFIHVLLVEDSNSDAELVTLQLAVDPQFVVKRVVRLAQALKSLQDANSEVVLLDLNLPDSMGLDTFTKLHRECPETPIVILSGQDDHELARAAVKQGAQDYLPKGVDPEALSRSLRYAIERNGRQLAERKVLQVEQDMRIARRVQRGLLPAAAPLVPGFDIAARCLPADVTGGDFFDFIPLSDGAWDLVVADVSSHGFGPALIMAATRRLLRTLAQNHSDVGEVLTIANRGVAEDTLEGQFVTMLLARLDPATRSLHYTSAGHEAFILHAEGTPTRLSGPHIPLGVVDDTEYKTAEPHALVAGDVLVLLTDGVTEAHDAAGAPFEHERVFDIVNTQRLRPAIEIVDTVVREVDAFCSPGVPADDLTVCIVKVL
jgi:serine phosphatase RsbU (regulator of sigma subunit)